MGPDSSADFELREVMDMGFCRKCTERWVGVRAAHCTGCHRTFKSVWGFDKHRVGIICKHPMDLGMEMNEKGIWVKPNPKYGRL